MKQISLITAAVAVCLGLTGCPTSQTGGTSKPAQGGQPAKDETFTLDKMLTSVSVKQGGAEDVTIKMNRGKDFQQNVKLSVDKAPDKVKVEFTSPTIKATDEAKAVMRVTADKEAAVGEHVLNVTATPDNGAATSIEVKVKVTKP